MDWIPKEHSEEEIEESLKRSKKTRLSFEGACDCILLILVIIFILNIDSIWGSVVDSLPRIDSLVSFIILPILFLGWLVFRWFFPKLLHRDN